MALPHDFMERVVAWPGPDGPGYVNLHWTSPKGPGVRGRPFKVVQDFMQAAQAAAAKPTTYKDIYFCLSTQSATGKAINNYATAARHKDSATFLKAIWLDVDVKPEKGYADRKEALRAIYRFIAAAGLPEPSALVFSGGGVHVYWIADRPLTPQEWRPYAEGLKAAALKHGLKCDAGITTDAARVLRVPGTYNWKTNPPASVVLAHLGDSYDFSRALAGIKHELASGPVVSATAAVTKPPPFDLSAFTGGPSSAFAELSPTMESLAAGLHGKDDRPLSAKMVLKNCVHYHETLRTGGKGQPQGLWMQTVLGATWFENGRDIAHALGDQYSGSSEEIRDEMYDRKLKDRAGDKLGWPSCNAFENEGAKCKTCPFYGKIRSPLNLAERVHSPGVVINPAPPPPVTELAFPDGYTVDARGWICQVVQKTTKDDMTVDEQFPLFMCKLRSFKAQGGNRKLLFETSLDMDRWGFCSLAEIDMVTEQAMLKALRRDGVKPYVDNQRRIMQFMTSFMAKLDSANKRIQTTPFGWLRDEKTKDLLGFAYGGRVVLKGGSTQAAGYADHQLEDWYTPKGTLQPWLTALRVITDQHRPALEAMVAAAFGAPLMMCTGLYNAFLHGWSAQSGVGKSTAIAVGASVWGMPQMTKESPMSSSKGVIHKLGEVRNLPVYWDEINSDEKIEQVRTILGVATEGSGGSLLHQDRTFRDRDAWQTLMVVGANKSLVGCIQKAVKDSDAQLQRVFEFDAYEGGGLHAYTLRQSDVSMLIGSLDHNYGNMGLLYQELLGSDPAAVQAQIKLVLHKFEDEVNHTAPERFRSAMAACIYTGACYANQLGATFNLDELWAWLKAQYLAQRQAIVEADLVGGSLSNTAGALTQFFKANVRNALWVETMPTTTAGRPVITYKAGPTMQRPDPIHIRLVVTDQIIEVSKARLIEYLGFHKYNPIAVINGLKAHFGASVVDRINLAAGSGILGGRETVVKIPVPIGSAFQALLYMHTPPDQRPAGVVIQEDDEGVVPVV